MAPMPNVNHTCLRASAPQLAQRAGAVRCRHGGHPQAHHDDGGHGNEPHKHEGRAPAKRLAQRGSYGHAHQRGGGQPQHDPPHGACAAAGRRQRSRHQRSHAKVGAVRQAGEQSHGAQRQVARRQRRREVAQRIHHHQRHQQRAAPPVGTQHGQHRCAHHHAQGIGADDVAGLRNAHANVARHLGQQAHDDELARADGETTHPQGQHGAHQRAVVGGGGIDGRGGQRRSHGKGNNRGKRPRQMTAQRKKKYRVWGGNRPEEETQLQG